MGVDIEFFTLRHPVEKLNAVLEFAKSLGVEDAVKFTSSYPIAYLGSGSEFLLNYFNYNEYYSEKIINISKISELFSLLKDCLLKCDTQVKQEVHKSIFVDTKLDDNVSDEVVYGKLSEKTHLACDKICFDYFKSFKFNSYNISFVDICYCYESIKSLLNETKDKYKTIIMVASW